MRKWLILLLILVAAVLGVMVWLNGVASGSKPDAGEQRIEIENVF